MKRRKFTKLIASGIAGLASGPSFSENVTASNIELKDKSFSQDGNSQMHVGHQNVLITKENLEFMVRHGVYHIDGKAPTYIDGVGWDLDDAYQKKDLCEEYGVTLEAYHLPLTSSGIDNQIFPNIMLGKSPERDSEIEIIKQMIEVAGKTGIRALLYNTTILPVLRTGDIPGRGNSSYRSWNYEEALGNSGELTIAGEVSLDEMYERITYLLDRILPVAEEWKVQLGNHIADPPLPTAYQGIWRWNSPDIQEGVKRFAQLYDSPYHGFNLCIGSCAEGMVDLNKEIHELIRFVGNRNQIFNIHLRNIKGGFNDFAEVHHDEGDINLFEVVKTLKDVDYKYMIMPDHVPLHPDDSGKKQAFAFSFGYINALIQSVNDTSACVTHTNEETSPNSFLLGNNYPNPFNLTTKIVYHIPKTTKVKLEVFNMFGEKVRTLVNETKNAGDHEINFDAAGLSSGSYIYRLTTPLHVFSKTMMLIK